MISALVISSFAVLVERNLNPSLSNTPIVIASEPNMLAPKWLLPVSVVSWMVLRSKIQYVKLRHFAPMSRYCLPIVLLINAGQSISQIYCFNIAIKLKLNINRQPQPSIAILWTYWRRCKTPLRQRLV